jgi:polysaccharide pyruvyl transferase CsaB
MASPRKIVLIAGYYGFGNTGDEAILTGMLRDLGATRPDLQFVVVSGNPEETSARYKVESILWTDLPRILKAAQECDLIILGGGGIFLDYWGAQSSTLLTKDHSGNSYFAGFPLLAALNGKPCMLYSVGVGPLFTEEGKSLTRMAFEAASAATVRDTESRELLEAMGVPTDQVRVTADPAYSIPTDDRRAKEILAAVGARPDAPLIGVCVRKWDVNVSPQYWQEQVAAALDRFSEAQNPSFIFVPFQALPGSGLTDDHEAAQTIRTLMRARGATHLLSDMLLPGEIAGILHQCDLVIGMRLHSLLFAIKESVPVVGVIYDPKVKNLMVREGIGEYAIELQALTSDRLFETINRAWSDRAKLRDHLGAGVGESRELAVENAKVALRLLDEKVAHQEISGSVVTFIKRFALMQTKHLAEQADILIERNGLLAERNGLLAELNRSQAESDRVLAERDLLLADQKDRLAEQTNLLAEKEHSINQLRGELADQQRALGLVSAQLHAKATELDSIRRSLGWRILSRYGRIKYRYLLPLYRMLRLIPLEPKVSAAEPPQLRALEAAENNKASLSPNYDVVCFPIIEWDFRFQRPQQLMARFAAAGHRVFYISQNFRSSGPAYSLEPKEYNVYEVSLRGPRLNPYTESIDDVARDQLLESLDALRRDLSLGATVAILQLPSWWPLAREMRARFAWPTVYDCMDHHQGFSTNGKEMLDQEEDLLLSADLVIASSALLESAALRHNRNVVLVNNACDYEHFANTPRSQSAKSTVGYYGAIAEWFDSDLVADLAKRRPDWDFLLVGSTFSADISRLSKLPNVRLPGEKAYQEIPDWLGKFDVAIIPFRRSPLTEATNPVKAYEILASGKPLVSVPIPEMVHLSSLVRLASSAPEFENEIAEALGESGSELAERRRAFAREHTWQKRYEALAPSVRNTFPKASIIIVTFNNLHLSRLCVESLYARTEWPNFEVIVVDNASTDGTPQYLKEVEERFPNLSVILNESNLGFAAANNIGLKRAEGHYLTLLNNDTVVSRGWLSSLIRHLAADDGIGLIGPTTNEIGNEAKVPVEYESLTAMPSWAAEFVRDNDGRTFDIPMLAMFCVMMRRGVLDAVGFLDEQFSVGMFEDDDYSKRVRERGYKIVCTRDSYIHHFGRASFKLLGDDRYREIFEKNRAVYEHKWGPWEPHFDESSRRRVPDLRHRLDEIVGESGVEQHRIVVFLPSIGWNTRVKQRLHHLAEEFARQGFLVFYDCTGSRADHFADFKAVESRLWLYKGPSGVLDLLESPIVWTLPYNARHVGRWTHRMIIYDVVDDLGAFPYSESFLRGNHDAMLRDAHLVLCALPILLEEIRQTRPDAVYLQDLPEYRRFARELFELESRGPLRSPRASPAR